MKSFQKKFNIVLSFSMNPKSVFLCELKECSKNKTTCSISDFTVIQVFSLFIAQTAIADENKYIPVPISTIIGKDTVYILYQGKLQIGILKKEKNS